MEDANSGSSSSSSSPPLPSGSKRGRSSSSSSSASSSTTRGSKRSKKEKDGVMEMHPGQWLYEEGRAYWYGMDLKKVNEGHGQLMIEASASAGFPMAVAYCHYCGWNGLKEDEKKAFDMFVKIEKETYGYHWVQKVLGDCYQFGHGVDADDKKAFEYYSLSSEQGNSLAMLSLGYCYEKGVGTDENAPKAFEWYKKSANLGNCAAMYNVGLYYKNGTGITKDLNKARKWYTRSAAQGEKDAQAELDELNAQ
jgi:TPR repeat protein